MARTKPFVKVHLAVADHPKTVEAWGSLELRGMLVELWRKAGEKYAAKRDDRVQLKPTDRMEIACTTDQEAADAAVTRLCKVMKYSLRKYPNRWEVHVRKFAKKQGFESPDLDDNSTTTRKDLDGFLGAETPKLRNSETLNAESRVPKADLGAAAPPAPSLASSKVSSGGKAGALPEQLDPDDRKRVQEWAARQSPPIEWQALNYAWGVFRTKARARGYAYADIAEGFMGALGATGEAWALKGFDERKPKPAYRRDESGQVLVPNEWRGLGS